MRTRFIGSAVAVCLALALGACGDDDSGSNDKGAAAAPAATANSGSADLAAIKKQSAEDQAGTVEFPKPTEAFDPGKKKAMVIACGFQAPVCASAAKEAVVAVKAMGWEPSDPQDGKLAPQTQAGLVTKAVQQGYSAIVMYGIDVNSIKAAIDAAVAKKVAVGCIVCSSGALRGKVIDATPDFEAQGEQMGRYLIAKNDGKAKIVAFEDNAFPQTTQRTDGIEKVVDASCPDCTFESIQQSVGETAKPGPPTFTAMLTKKRSGDLTDAVALYDGIGIPMATTLKSRGRDDFVVDGYDAEQPVLEALKSGALPYGATSASPVNYAAWSAVDQVGRRVAGAPEWDSTKLPTLLLTKENAAKYIGKQYEPEGDWRAEFKKLWGQG